MNHILNPIEDKHLLENLFRKISEGNTILFLGAGASITEKKKYLSKDIIELYEDKIRKKFGIDDIVEFTDIIEVTEGLSRSDFDLFVQKLLLKLDYTETHKIIASIKWREIITTNMDLLLERAYDEIKNTISKEFDLYPVRSLQESYNKISADQVWYTKLNGCISDISKYPLIFSNDDFESSKAFYKKVLLEFKSMDYNIEFLSVGYSFSDPFAKQLLEKFDFYHFRARRWMYCVDPYVNDSQLDYFTSKKICIIKMSNEEFFSLYNKWENDNYETIVKAKRVSFYRTDESLVNIPNKLALRLNEAVKQLNNKYKSDNISDIDYYMGEEPSYEVILKEYDVIRYERIKKAKIVLNEYLKSNETNIIPIFFISGYFGIGKSTFAYRLINEIQKDGDVICYEILDPTKLNARDLFELFQNSKAKKIILLANFIERETFFNAILELRHNLNIEEINAFEIFFIIPIRENVFEKYKVKNTIKNSFELEIDAKLTDDEIEDLLEKLKSSGLITYRDLNEKRKFINRIKKDYDSETFITYIDLITEGKHIQDLLEAYGKLPKIAQNSFVFTSLLHSFKIPMPISLLKSLVAKEWDTFINDLIKIDLKGILFQKKFSSTGITSDYYFVTRHSVIAKHLIDKIVPNYDDRFELYIKIFSHITPGESNVRITIDLLHTLRMSGMFNELKINKLFDIAYINLNNEPYFLLHYCINLQFRRTKHFLIKGINLLKYAEALLSKRNHKFIHRRAVMNFELAKLTFEEEKELIITNQYLQEARELFLLKMIYDPGSHFSFVSLIEMELWVLKHVILNEEEILKKKLQIQEYFDLADKSVTDNIDKINELKQIFVENYLYEHDENKYKERLLSYYDDEKFRPYALILLYNYYVSMNDSKMANKYIQEIEIYSYLDEVSKFLVKYYGRNLQINLNRKKFHDLLEIHTEFEKSDSIRYNYFNFVSESYNMRFDKARSYLDNIQYKHYYTINPDYKNTWKEFDSNEDRIFDGYIIKTSRGIYKAKVNILQQVFVFVKKDYSRKLVEKLNIKVKLHFFINGIKAEIVEMLEK